MSMFSGMAAEGWGAISTAGSASQQGRAARKMYEYKAQVAENNKVIAEQNRQRAIETGQQHAQIAMLKGGAKREAAVANFSKGNLAVNPNTSAGGVVQVIDEMRGLEGATIRNNAARKAYQYELASLGFTHEATMDKWLGERAEKAGYRAATGALVTGVGSVGSKWGKYYSNDNPDGGDNEGTQGGTKDRENRDKLEAGDNSDWSDDTYL